MSDSSSPSPRRHGRPAAAPPARPPGSPTPHRGGSRASLSLLCIAAATLAGGCATRHRERPAGDSVTVLRPAVPAAVVTSAGTTPTPTGLGGSDTIHVHDVGFDGPENLAYDSVADVFLISNMHGGATAKDDNGFIARVAPDGRVLALKWIEGGKGGAHLDAPKGIRVHGDTIAVADLGAVHFFDRTSGRPLGSVPMPGLVMNDLAYGGGPAGQEALYVTDTGPGRSQEPVDTSRDLDAVWRIEPASAQGRVTPIARGLVLDRPDGLVLDGRDALVATFGANRVERVSLLAGGAPKPATVVTLPGGKVDGLRRLPNGDLVVTSWDAKSVYRVGADGKPQPILTGIESPAGVAIDTRRHRLAVTSNTGNELVLVPLR